MDTLRLTLDSSPLVGVIREPESTLGSKSTSSIVVPLVKIGIDLSGILFSFSITVLDCRVGVSVTT